MDSKPARPVILTPGSSLSALGFTRSLGERGIPVFAVGGGTGPGLYSRYCVSVGLDRIELRPILEAVGRIARSTGRRPIILPCSDESAAVISSNIAAFEEFADAPIFRESISDECLTKIGLDKGARRLGAPVPKSAFPSALEELDEAGSEVGYPCVVKPNQTKKLETALGVKAFLASNHHELRALYARCRDKGIEVFLQEFIPGGTMSNYGFAAYFDRKSNPHCILTYRRLLDWPCDSPGISAMTESVQEPELARTAVEFFRGIGFTGIAQAEYVRDPRDGRWKLLDVNPRAWTSNRLASALGCDIPFAAYSECIGSIVDPVGANGSARWLNLMDSAFALLRKALAGETPVLGTLGPGSRLVHAVFDRRDPAPFARQFASVGLASRMRAVLRPESGWERAERSLSS